MFSFSFLGRRGRKLGLNEWPRGLGRRRPAASVGTYSETSTSRANSVDVAVSSISGECIAGTVQAVHVVASTKDADGKALLAGNPCEIIEYGDPLMGLTTVHTGSVRTHELESANRDFTLLQSGISQQSFQTTANVVALGNSVGFPGSIPAPFGVRAEDRQSGNSLLRIVYSWRMCRTRVMMRRGTSDGLSYGSVGVPSSGTEGTHAQLQVAGSPGTQGVSITTDNPVVCVGRSVGRTDGRSVGRSVGVPTGEREGLEQSGTAGHCDGCRGADDQRGW